MGKSLSDASLLSSSGSDIMVVAGSQPGWECLHHGITNTANQAHFPSPKSWLLNFTSRPLSTPEMRTPKRAFWDGVYQGISQMRRYLNWDSQAEECLCLGSLSSWALLSFAIFFCQSGICFSAPGLGGEMTVGADL